MSEREPLRLAVLDSGGVEDLWGRLPDLDGGAEFSEAWETFMARHGHHTRGELELSNPRWSERPDRVLDQLRGYLEGTEERDLLAHHEAVARRREETTASCRRALRNPLKRLIFGIALGVAQRSAPYRETLKSQVVRKLAAVRTLLLELGRRWARRGDLSDPDDVFYLRLGELDDDLDGVSERIAARRAERERFQQITPPPVVRGQFDPGSHTEAVAEGMVSGELSGTAVSPGVVVGLARVILRAGDDRVLPGEILVAPFTDPGWTPYFLNAAAIVMDLGGLLSHGSIIARELGIPAVVNVHQATRRIHTGQRLEVDGARVSVRVLAD